MAAKPSEVLRPKSLAEALQLMELGSMPSTGDEVEAAFRKLALKYHPDKGGDGNNWLRLQAARNYLRDMLAKKEQAAEDPVSKAKGRLPWLGCYCDVCLPSIMKMAICKGCLVGGGHTCGVLTQMSGRLSKEAKAFMVVKRTHDAMSEQAQLVFSCRHLSTEI